MKIIFDYNRTIFNPETNNMYIGVLEILKTLSVKHNLFLVSKEEIGRDEMFNSLRISQYFTKVLFVKEKTTKIFKEIAGEDIDVLIIGDRVRGEISIGNQLGFITIWVKQGKFANEAPRNNKETPNHSIDSINQLIETIRIYE